MNYFGFTLSDLRVAGIGAALLAAGSLAAPHAAADERGYEVVSEPEVEIGETVPSPEGRIILTVDGDIDYDGGVLELDMELLESLGVVRYTTPTSWTDDDVTFDGILLGRLMELVGASEDATTLELTALNDYSATMPIDDAYEWPVILAFKEDGEFMSPRERGPLWVVYPQHLDSRHGNREVMSRWVWQLERITVQ